MPTLTPRCRWSLLTLVAALLVAASACGRGSSGSGTGTAATGQVVRSADGSAELRVPTGALPGGVTASDIQVVAVDPAKVLRVLDGGPAPLAAYQLLPDGLTLSQPATVTITRPQKDVTRAMWVLHLSGEKGVELITDVDVTSVDDTSATVSFAVNHFSTVVLEWPLGMEYSSNPERLAYQHFPVGPFNWTWTINRTQGATRVVTTHGVQIEITLTGLPWTVEGTARGQLVVGPGSTQAAPALSTVTADSYSQTLQMECLRPGSGHIFHDVTVNYPSHYRVTLPGGPTTEDTPTLRSRFAPNIFVNCDAVPTRTPTPATSGRAPVVTELAAVIQPPVTTYSIVANDPDGGALRYEWAMAGETCGTPRVPWKQTGPTARWSHSNLPPDSCGHTGTEHAVVVSVTVTTVGGRSVQCLITGTETQTLKNPPCQ